MTFTDDTRATTIPITHAMTLGITALLMATLLVGAGLFINQQQETVARSQLSEVGGDVVAQLNTLDRLNGSGESVTATFEPSYVRRAGGATYTVALVTHGPSPPTEATLYVNSSAMDHPVRLPVRTDTPMLADRVRGENPTVSLCDTPAGQRITLGECP